MPEESEINSGTLTVQLLGAAVACVILGLMIEQRWRYWDTHDKIDLFVAIGTMLLAGCTAVLARSTAQSVKSAGKIISADDLRHRQSLAPIIRLKPNIDKVKGLVTGFELINDGLGPALGVMVIGSVEYERRNEQSQVLNKQQFDMQRLGAASIGPRDRVTVSNGAPNGWVLAAAIGPSSRILIQYTDIFGNVYESTGRHTLDEWMTWVPADQLFDPVERQKLIDLYFKRTQMK